MVVDGKSSHCQASSRGRRDLGLAGPVSARLRVWSLHVVLFGLGWVRMSLGATSYVVLGLVSLRPRAGHELARYAERSIGNFFALTRSQVYVELDRLRRLGLLEATEVPQERLPTKRVYEITAEGEAVLGEWLENASLDSDRQRNLFLVRVFFADRMSPARLVAILDDYAAQASARRDRLGEMVDRLVDRPQAAFRRATASFGVHREQAKLDWIAEIRPLMLAALAGAAPRDEDEP
jgi:DNA-binding PadR family transcriptional regulator